MDPNALDRFARHHNGLVTLAAALDAGMSKRSWRRAVEQGRFIGLHTGVARCPARDHSEPDDPRRGAGGEGRRDGLAPRGRAAWGVPRPDDEDVDVLLPQRNRQATVTGALIHRPRDVLDLNPSTRERVPCTNILRTLCDLGVLDPGAVTGAVGHVVSTDLASPAALEAAIRRHGRRGRPGVPALREALADWVLDGKPVDSILEPAMHRLLADNGLPAAEFHPVIGGHEVDFRIVGSPIVLECDGWATHGLKKEAVRARPSTGC